MSLRSIIMLMPKASTRVCATWNPADKGVQINLYSGNLQAQAVTDGSVRSTISKTSGDWYWELFVLADGSNRFSGIMNASGSTEGYPGSDANGIGWLGNTGDVLKNGASIGTAATYIAGDTLGFAYSASANTLKLYKNNTLSLTVASGNMPSGAIFAACGGGFSARYPLFNANFGATALTYTPPAGYNSGLYT